MSYKNRTNVSFAPSHFLNRSGEANVARAYLGAELDEGSDAFKDTIRFLILDGDIKQGGSHDGAITGGPAFMYETATPTDGDYYRLRLQALDSAFNPTNYAAIDITTVDVTNATEDGRLALLSMHAGTLHESIRLDATEVRLDPLAGYLNAEGLNSRFRLVWVAGARGKPGINGDIQNAAEATRMIADPDFEILGTNHSSDDVTYNAEGGITLETDGADSDQIILLPHLDANQSAWAQVTWGTDQQVRWECVLATEASIVDAIIWAGLKLTNTNVTATDADQVFFRYEEGVNSGEWQAISSINNSDDAHDTNVAVAANTVYHLVIEIDSSRIARFYINGALVETSAALTDAIDLIPYIGVFCQAGGASGAKSISVRGQAISREYA